MNWQEFIHLKENKGLTTEQMRRNYMWYLQFNEYNFTSRGGPVENATQPQYIWWGEFNPEVNGYVEQQTFLGQTSEGPFDWFYTSIQSLQSKLSTTKIGAITIDDEYMTTTYSNQISWYVGPTSPTWTSYWPGEGFPVTKEITWNQVNGIEYSRTLINNSTYLELSNWQLTIPDYAGVEGSSYEVIFPQNSLTLSNFAIGAVTDQDNGFWQSYIGAQGVASASYDGGTDVYTLTLTNVYANILSIADITITSDLTFNVFPFTQI